MPTLMVIAVMAAACGESAVERTANQGSAADPAASGQPSTSETAAGGELAEDQAARSQTQLEEGAGEGLEIPYVSAPIGSVLYRGAACGAKAAADRLGVSFEHQESETFSPESQIPLLNAVVASDPDALLISPTSPEALVGPLQTVADSGTPVVSFVNTLNDPSPLAASVEFDNLEAGRMAADFMAERAAGAEVSVAVLSFMAGGSNAADDLWKGFEERIANYENIEYLGPQFVSDDPAESTAAVNALLARDPDLFGLWTWVGTGAKGAYPALRQNDSDALVVSGYASRDEEVLEALETGQQAAILDFDSVGGGNLAMELAVRSVLGMELPPSSIVPPTLYTAEDAADLRAATESGCIANYEDEVEGADR